MSASPVTPFDEVLAAGGERVRALMGRSERHLNDITSAHGAELARSAGGTLAAGGKRLRPLLAFICGAASEEEALVRAATAVELVHMATLVHDDVLDGALLRRGRPTVYAAAGRDAATTTGDFLFSRAFSLLSANQEPDQVRTLSEACLALARGELAQRQDAYSSDVDSERYLHRCELKTATLFAAACKLGALAAGHGESAAGTLGAYGHKLGLAFQILDDVLDVSGPTELTGKARGSDLLEGTVTLPLILARRLDSGLASLDLRSVESTERAEQICERIVASGALEEVRRRADELVAEAKACLSAELDRARSDLLTLVADRMVGRYN